MNNEIFLDVKDVKKTFRIGASVFPVLKGVSFTARRGEWIALLGASGSGKTTLLDIIGTISRPDAGSISITDVETSKLSSSAAVDFRRAKIGFVFQAYHMLPELTILENVKLPAMLAGKSASSCASKAEELLGKVGLSHRLKHRPNELSGGEQQRAAIARSLINSPELILADEPTGNLDSVTGGGILEIFKTIHAEGTATILMVTHDRNVAALADRVIELSDGFIADSDADEEA